MGVVSVDIEYNLARSPGEQRAARDIPQRVGRDPPAWRRGGAGQPLAADEQADQQEQDPPAAAAQRVEPEGRNQREQPGLDRGPAEFPGAEGGGRRDRRGEPARRLVDQPKQDRDRQPGQRQPAERHRPRKSRGTYPGPRSPRPGRAAVSLPWSSTVCPFTMT